MKIDKPYELLHKEVYDKNGYAIGLIDKIWDSWNIDYPGFFFGIRTNQVIRKRCFRGTFKLVPILERHIDNLSGHVTLCKTIDELYRFWNKTINCGLKTCTTGDLLDKPVYDKNYSRVGIFFTSVESDGPSNHCGICVDPYLCDIWKTPPNRLMPIPTNYITDVQDVIIINKTIYELKKYWTEHFDY